MSIEKMIRLHPEVGADFNEALALAARHSMLCTSCADGRSAENMDMSRCIRTCMDCAAACAATARLRVRRTGQNIALLRPQVALCIQACETCAAECGRHEYCTLCATMCRECADACRKALPSIN